MEERAKPESPKGEAAAPPTGKEAPQAAAKGAAAKSEGKSPAAAAAGSGPALVVKLGVVVGALALGTVAGTFVVGPRVLPSRAAAGPAQAEHADAAVAPGAKVSHGAKASHGDKAKEKPVIHRIDNLIVNPAGSRGTHFLMASVTIESPGADVEEELRAHDDQVRDLIITVLEAQTLEALTRPWARDSVKVQIERVLRPIAPEAEWLRVYMPQFVVQ
jgi:flagellar protein FliL